ncbi:hypothetical protein FDC64_11215 [Clostridium botulinum]|uniref:hypothetical protein n=1 Tax=Clostridium botulinum TaxID=1491 RepID=UPI0004D00073|nr:hypothetical protein [Clostridium botulinum]MBY6773649.1 hypothetical protein [Clostridium botulinum]MBY6864243.1 hypothetical protein [Clostridium botulinum]MBY6984813.1 hypothetical protein [Clostridium botulinum]NFP26126.1 hypothetical protein [Clostridium botulinum]
MQIDKKTINYIKKSIEIHLSILEQNKKNILLKDEKTKENIENSIKHLKNVLDILKERELVDKKRVVYTKYLDYKKKWMYGKDPKDKEKMESYLEYYISLKELCNLT